MGLNLHVVGPTTTRNSMRFLNMLNQYAFWATLLAKILTFSLKTPQPGFLVWHVLHLVSTLHTVMYSVRCRQVAMDDYRLAKEFVGGEGSGSAVDVVVGKEDESGRTTPPSV